MFGVAASEQEAQPQQRACHSTSPSWGERSSGGDAETFSSQPENSKHTTSYFRVRISDTYWSDFSLQQSAGSTQDV